MCLTDLLVEKRIECLFWGAFLFLTSAKICSVVNVLFKRCSTPYKGVNKKVFLVVFQETKRHAQSYRIVHKHIQFRGRNVVVSPRLNKDSKGLLNSQGE